MITRIVSNLAVGLAVLALAGCTPRTADVASDKSAALDPAVYRDNVTGCEYLSTGQYHALTPRFDATGKQVCKAAQP